MTLVFEKNGKVDNRFSEYQKEILELGKEKAKAEDELNQVKSKVSELRSLEALAEDNIRSQKVIFDKHSEVNKKLIKNVEDRIKLRSDSISDLTKKEEELDYSIKKKEVKLRLLEREAEDALVSSEIIDSAVNTLKENLVKAKKEIADIGAELLEKKNEKEKLLNNIKDGYLLGKELRDDLVKLTDELDEIEEILNVKKTDNKEYLDAVSSFDAERKRLKEKEEFLLRKEKDLEVYEKRIQKDNPDFKMKFI